MFLARSVEDPGPKTELAVSLRGGLLASAAAVLLRGPAIFFHTPKTRRRVWISDQFRQNHGTLCAMITRLATFWAIITRDEYAQLSAGGRRRGAELLALVMEDELVEVPQLCAGCFCSGWVGQANVPQQLLNSFATLPFSNQQPPNVSHQHFPAAFPHLPNVPQQLPKSSPAAFQHLPTFPNSIPAASHCSATASDNEGARLYDVFKTSFPARRAWTSRPPPGTFLS